MFYFSISVCWWGNLKKFKVFGDKIVGLGGVFVLDDSGKIVFNVYIFWLVDSEKLDGNDVKFGGVNVYLVK